jgi:acetylglutamate kinase
MTRFLEERGVQSEFVEGLRVSTEQVVDAALHVIAGTVNKRLVAALTAAGQQAFGLSGVDGLLTPATRMSERLGWVGRAGSTRAEILHLLLSAGLLPVVACVGGDAEGNVYNVNADQMAVSCAAALRAEKLIFLTDVAGLKDGNGQIVPQLTPAAARELIASGVAHGGMQAKLEAATDALSKGIREVVIAPGQNEGLATQLLIRSGLGTRLAEPSTRAEEASA